MEEHRLGQDQMDAYAQYLRDEERAPGTIEKYTRDVQAFLRFAEGVPVNKAVVAAWKERLIAQGYAPVTINSMLAALHGLLDLLGWHECKVKYMRIQRRLFRDASRELEKTEYERLIATALERKQTRLALLMETICATGIRVSEVRYITVEAAKQGKAEITLKGKVRIILIPGKLSRKLLKFARKNKTASGEIFLTGSGKGLSRRQIWAEMKALCVHAGISAAKVFPHNLRHLFARAFYRACRDIAHLADVLGHSSIETTRIYLMTAGSEQKRQIEKLGFVS